MLFENISEGEKKNNLQARKINNERKDKTFPFEYIFWTVDFDFMFMMKEKIIKIVCFHSSIKFSQTFLCLSFNARLISVYDIKHRNID